MGNSCSSGCCWWCLRWRLFVLSFLPLDVLDEIWDVIESVSERFLIYSCYFCESSFLFYLSFNSYKIMH